MPMKLHHLALLALGIQGSSLQVPTLQEIIIADFEVVSTALVRSGETDFPLNALETSAMKFVWMLDGTLLESMRQCTCLDLSGMGLKRLPMYAIIHMESLRVLDISKNTGLVISQEDAGYLGRTVEKVIFQYSNAGTETVRQLLRLPRLASLDLSGNDLSRVVDDLDVAFGGLRELYLRECELGMSVFEKIVGCRELRILDVSKNWNIGRGISRRFDFGSLKDSLVELSIYGSDLGLGGLKAIRQLRQLKRLNVGGNNGIGRRMTRWFSFGGLERSLVELNMYCSDVGPGGLTAISQCKGIRKLVLGGNQKIGKGLRSGFDLGHLTGSLVELDMRLCGLTAEGLRALTTCTGLKKLHVSYNTDMGTGMGQDFDLGNLKDTLVELDVECTSLAAPGLEIIGQCRVLEKLDISSNAEVFEGINGLTLGEPTHTLRDLRARRAGMAIGGLRLLCQCTKLERLDVGGNSEIGNDPTDGFSFGALEQTLVELKMDSTQVSKDIFKALCRCRAVKRLDVAWNRKVGVYVTEMGLGSLRNTVEGVDLCGVGLGVNGLRQICECTKLKTLEAGWNTQLLGTLDGGFDVGRLTHSLMSLDVSMSGSGDVADEIMRTVFRKRGMAQIEALSPQ